MQLSEEEIGIILGLLNMEFGIRHETTSQYHTYTRDGYGLMFEMKDITKDNLVASVESLVVETFLGCFSGSKTERVCKSIAARANLKTDLKL